IAGTSVGAAVGGGAGAAAAGNATVNNYLSAADLRSRGQKLDDCRSQGNPQCEVNVIREYERKSANNTAAINYRSVVSVDGMQQEKSALQQVLQDPNVSPETRVHAQKSITELDRAINVIQRSPVIQDAMQMGLMVADVATLGEMAGARILTSSVVKEFLASRGARVTEAEATRIAENFYKEAQAPTSPEVAPPVRPTPRQSEIDVGLDLPPGARPQVSYKNGQEVPYGTSGSVRPDYCLGNVCSVEVKNYNIATNSNGLIKNVS
ncbi:hypothetical protein NBM50_17190, partial [Xylophilus ampelinus]|nr:hypothetical protein [Xylophilus ampelinus]